MYASIEELLTYDFNKLTRRMTQDLSVYDISAEDFLGFAKIDFEGHDLRSWVNALGNAKRAIECRIDVLLYNFCLHKKSEKERWDFPRKIEILRRLGIVAPNILRRMTKKRNELEHQYIKPTEEDVNDAIDVAELFLSATNEQAIVQYDAPNDFKVELKHEEGLVRLVDSKNGVEKTIRINSDDGWIEFAKRLAGLSKPSPIRFYRQSRK